MISNKRKFVVAFAIVICAVSANFSIASANPNANVEAIVRASFPDMPKMIDIAKCESGYRQFNADETPLRGGTGKAYIGIFQIGERLHREKALSMAYDINTIEGNIAYARYMYFASGTVPWKGCLTEAPTPSPVPAPIPNPVAISGSLTSTLSFGMTNQQVLSLQQILNNKGFTIAPSGPGSPGNETSYFGSLTREAVRKFQCAKGIACEGSESTTGFGLVGPRTRAALTQ